MTDVAEIAAKHCTPRAKRMLRHIAYVEGTQYEGRHPFLQEGDNAPPLIERAPCIVYPVVPNAINSHRDFVLGEGRWPAVRPRAGSLASEDVEAEVAEELRRLENTSRAPVVSREAFEDALGCGTSVAIVCVREGRAEIETVLAAWCTPTFDKRRRVTSLEIRYPYTDTYFDEREGKYVERCMLYRRFIDATTDTVFDPQVAPENGSAPAQWTEAKDGKVTDAARSFGTRVSRSIAPSLRSTATRCTSATTTRSTR